MSQVQEINMAVYDYPLPDERIARYPLEQRDASKLLLYRQGNIAESRFSELVRFLPEKALLVFNDTKVIQARMHFQKESGASVEIFCLEPWQTPVSVAFSERESVTWKCLIGNNRRWKTPKLERRLQVNGQSIRLWAERLQSATDAWIVRFTWEGGISFAELLETVGEMPLPPYLHRKAEESDKERYQTVYAHYSGSVAAPTAGLHFTEQVFDDLRKAGMETEFVTLHVGAGTFKPVTSDTAGEHVMHTEQVVLTKAQIEHVYKHLDRPLVAVGTTSVRTLESLYWYGVQLYRGKDDGQMHVPQWYPYQQAETPPSASVALEQVLERMEKEGLDHLNGETQLMIVPSYRYHLVNGIITNFHQPKSTLLLLVSAFIGEDWKSVYQYALSHDFRFLSYGDSCLFLP